MAVVPLYHDGPAPSGVRPDLWEQVRTAHCVFFLEPGSYAAHVVDRVAERAEATYQWGSAAFGLEHPPELSIYLVSGLDQTTRPDWQPLAGTLVAVDRPSLWIGVSPEQPADGLEWAILEALARAASGAVAPDSRGALEALASLLAADHGLGPRPEEADVAAHARHVRDGVPPQLFAAEAGGGGVVEDLSALSFLRFLRQTYGGTALTRFARALLTGGPTAAAEAAYRRSLPDLEQEWLGALRTRQRAAASWLDLLRRSLPALLPYRVRVLEVLGYMLMDLGFGLAIPLSVKYLLDDVIPSRDVGRLALWLVAVLAIFGLGSFANYRRTLVSNLVGELVLRDLRRAAFAHLQRLSHRFYARSSSGDLLARLTGDLDALRGTMSDTLPRLLIQVLSLVVGAVALLLLNWQLGLLVLLLGAPISIWVCQWASEPLRQVGRERQDRVAAMTAFLQENLTAQQVVKSYGLERRALAAFEQFVGQVFLGSMAMTRLNALLFSSSMLVFLAIRVVVLTAGAALVMSDQMTVGALVAFVEMIVQVLSPVGSLSGLYQQLQGATGSFERVEELMQEVPEVAEDPLAVELPKLRHEIRFEGVSFRYDNAETALRDVSLVIPAGARVGVVGPSGAGKSTFIGLLLRLYDPSSGRILFDGQDIRQATLSSLRRQQALVPQDTFLFNATIGENVALAREDATAAAIERAARAAAVHEVIERSEQGYGTVVGERGVRLSGGQRQRLAIARALLRDPRLLLLDEATSALDPATEAAIEHTLEQASRGRTTVAITHRLSSVVGCDVIFVLDRGRLVEQGTHQELLDLRGLYWRLYTEQQAGLADAGVLPIDPRRLARVPLFASLPLGELRAVAQRITVERYPAGAFVVHQGAEADKLFVLGDGEAEVLVEDASSQARRVKVLRPRSYFGEIALLGEGVASRTASVRTLAPARLYSLHKEDFLDLLKTHPGLAEAVGRLAGMRRQQTRLLAAAA